MLGILQLVLLECGGDEAQVVHGLCLQRGVALDGELLRRVPAVVTQVDIQRTFADQCGALSQSAGRASG